MLYCNYEWNLCKCRELPPWLQPVFDPTEWLSPKEAHRKYPAAGAAIPSEAASRPDPFARYVLAHTSANLKHFMLPSPPVDYTSSECLFSFMCVELL